MKTPQVLETDAAQIETEFSNSRAAGAEWLTSPRAEGPQGPVLNKSAAGKSWSNSWFIFSAAVPRRDPITENGMAMAPVGPLGLATAIGFQPTGRARAIVARLPGR